jgi:hypothetical protein
MKRPDLIDVANALGYVAGAVVVLVAVVFPLYILLDALIQAI